MNTDMMYTIGQWAGLIGFILISTQFLTSMKIKPLKQKFGPKLIAIHRKIGVIGFVFICAHPLLIIAYQNQTFGQTTMNQYMMVGSIGFVLLLTTVLTSIVRQRLKLSYNIWKTIHLANYIVFPLVYFHSLMLGSNLLSYPALRWLWYALFGIYLFSVIYKGKELVNSYQSDISHTNGKNDSKAK